MSSPVPTDIPFHRGNHTSADLSAVEEVLASGRTGGGGAVGERVEAMLREIGGCRHALLMSSCTHAMEACLLALGLGPGDEVIVPGFLYVSLAAAVARQGARPVFADVEAERLGLDPVCVEAAIGPRTRAIFAVHYGGVPCRIGELLEIGRRHGIPVLEDAAQAMGSREGGGRALGSLGLAGCVSFHESKNVSCGEGGAVLTDDSKLALALETIRDKGTNRAAAVRGELPHYTWVSHGSSFSLSELQAAILEVQLEAMHSIEIERQRVAARYLAALAGLAGRHGLGLPVEPRSGEHFNWHIFHLLLPDHVSRDQVGRQMRERGIHTAAHFQTLHDSPFHRALSDAAPTRLPVTESLCARILRLPIYPSLSDADVDRVVDTLAEILDGGILEGAGRGASLGRRS